MDEFGKNMWANQTKSYGQVWKQDNRVTLKIDVAYTDHSYIIGKGGQQIQSIMNSTNCHIHFPDGNKNRTSEKSNQVTISGLANNAERARQLVRQCLLVNVSFDIPINGETILLIDNSHPTIQLIQNKYNVVINIKYNQEFSEFSSPLATVYMKGLKTKFNELKEAMLAFWVHLTGSEKGFNGVFMRICVEIGTQNQRFVMGKGNCNIKTINSQTGAVVIFPNIIASGNYSLDSGKERNNSTVEVRGKGIDSAFLGWLHILGLLPMVLIFDIEPNHELDSKLMTNLMANLPVDISIRYKNRSTQKRILLKGYEKNSNILLEAYNQLVSNQQTLTQTQLPQSLSNQYYLQQKISSLTEQCINRSYTNMSFSMNAENARFDNLTPNQSPNKYNFDNKLTAVSFSTSPTQDSHENLGIPWTSTCFGNQTRDFSDIRRQPSSTITSLSNSLTEQIFKDCKIGEENQSETKNEDIFRRYAWF